MEQNQKLITRVIDTLRDRHVVLHCLQIMPKNKFTFTKVYHDAQGENARRRYATVKLDVRTTVVLKKVRVGHGTGHERPEGEYRYSSTLSVTSVLDWGRWSTPRPGRFTPVKETRYLLYRSLCGAQGRFGRVQKI